MGQKTQPAAAGRTSPRTSPSGSGTGPEQALEAITLPPSRTARKVHTSPELPCARRTSPAEQAHAHANSQTHKIKTNTCDTSYLASQSTYDDKLALPCLHYGIPPVAHHPADAAMDQSEVDAMVGRRPHHPDRRVGPGLRRSNHRRPTRRKIRGPRIVRTDVRLAVRPPVAPPPPHPLRCHPLGAAGPPTWNTHHRTEAHELRLNSSDPSFPDLPTASPDPQP